jgi:hypothetical protein
LPGGRAVGATVYDEAGVPIMTGGSEQPLPAASPPQRPAAGPRRYARIRSRPAGRTSLAAVTPNYTGCPQADRSARCRHRTAGP